LKEDELLGESALGDAVNPEDHFTVNHFDAVIDVVPSMQGHQHCQNYFGIGTDHLEAWQPSIFHDGWFRIAWIRIRETDRGSNLRGSECGTVPEMGLYRFFSMQEVQSLFYMFAEVGIERFRRGMDDIGPWYGQ
jgi:hypothetical protein